MQILGIYFDSPFIRVALLKKQGKNLEIIHLKSFSHLDIEEVKQLYTAPFKRKVVSGLSAKDLLIRSIDLKGFKDRHTDEIIAFQSEATSYLDPSEVLSVPYYYSKTKGKIEGLLFTAPKVSIRFHLEAFQKIGISPDLVTAVPLALIRYVQWKMPELQDAVIIDLGSADWTCISMEKGRIIKSHSIPGGIEILLASLWEDRKKILLLKELEGFAKQIDLLQLKAHLNPHLSAKLCEMRQELGKIAYSFCRSTEAKPLIFTGRIDSFGHLQQYLIEGLKDIASFEWRPISSSEHQKYAIPIGLGLEYSPNSLQLQRGEFFPKKNWIQAGKYFFSLLIGAFLISGTALFFAHRTEKSRKTQMIDSLKTMLASRDQALKESIFQPGVKEEEILARWNKNILSHLQKEDLSIKPIKVSETLSWLFNHPLLQQLKAENDPLEILRFRYRLDSYPKVDNPKIPFKTKIEIEFRFKNPMNARKFHESFLMKDSWVDADSEITWEALRDSYRASFFLKRQNL